MASMGASWPVSGRVARGRGVRCSRTRSLTRNAPSAVVRERELDRDSPSVRTRVEGICWVADMSSSGEESNQ